MSINTYDYNTEQDNFIALLSIQNSRTRNDRLIAWKNKWDAALKQIDEQPQEVNLEWTFTSSSHQHWDTRRRMEEKAAEAGVRVPWKTVVEEEEEGTIEGTRQTTATSGDASSQ